MAGEREPAQSSPVVSSGAPTTPPAPAPSQGERPPHSHERGLGPAFYLKLAALLFFLGWVIAFAVGNDRTISVDFVFATGNVSLIWTILLLLLLGAVAGLLLAHLYRRHGRKQVRQP
jgi:uncharacterized integral membrane protein